MSLLFNLSKDTLIYGLGSLITRFMSFIAIPLFTSFLSPEEYGNVAIISLFNMFIIPLFMLGLDSSLGTCYFESESITDKNKVLCSAITINLIAAFSIVIFGFLIKDILCEFINLPIVNSDLLFLSISGSAFVILSTTFMLRMQFENRSNYYAIFTIFSMLLNILFSYYSIVYLNYGVKGIILGQVIGSASNCLCFMIFYQFNDLRLNFDFKIINLLIKRGLFFIPSYYGIFFIVHSNKYIIESILGLNDLGIYSVGFNLGMVISVITSGFATSWFIFFMNYTNRQLEATEIFPIIFIYYVFLTGFICIIFYLFAKPVVLYFIDDKFHYSYKVVGIVAFANFIQIFFNLFLPGIYYNNHTKYISLILLFSALISIPINIVLITKYGIVGAAYGLLCGNIVISTTTYLWNYLNRSKYPVFIYQWGRAFFFLAWSFLLILIYNNIIVINILDEFIKSFIFSVLALFIIYLNFKKYISKLNILLK